MPEGALQTNSTSTQSGSISSSANPVVALIATDQASRQGHCAWCGNPPDAYGSHGICADHAKQLMEQARVRRDRRTKGAAL